MIRCVDEGPCFCQTMKELVQYLLKLWRFIWRYAEEPSLEQMIGRFNIWLEDLIFELATIL